MPATEPEPPPPPATPSQLEPLAIEAEGMLAERMCSWRWRGWEVWLILMVFVVYAGDPAPAINEAHYLAKAKNFWQPDWCAGDLFVRSGKAHTTFYWVFGWLTNFFSFETTAWIGRIVGWLLLAVGLQRLTWAVVPVRYASVLAAFLWLAGIEHGNLAGEWVVGGIEAKVPAYGFVLLALERMVRGDWKTVWPLLGAASAFHVLVGGWSVLCGGLVWLTSGKQRSSVVSQILPLAIGGAIALFGLLPALWLTEGTSETDAIAAARTYVYQRIPHHLLPADFAVAWYVRHGLLIALTTSLFIIQKTDRRIRAVGWFAVGAVLLAGIGLLIGLLPESHPDLAAKWLRFYWFRLTDSAVPLAMALATVRLLAVPTRWDRGGWGHGLAWSLVTVLSLAGVLLVAQHSLQKYESGLPASCDLHSQGNFPETSVAERQAVCRSWIDACHWIRDNTDPDAVFLTPRHQQTFKWYAERAEVVNYKDVPQDVPNLKEWQTRFDRVFPPELGRIRITIQYSELEKFRRQYGAEYMVVDRRIAPYSMPLQKVYPTAWEPNEYYAVYRLP